MQLQSLRVICSLLRQSLASNGHGCQVPSITHSLLKCHLPVLQTTQACISTQSPHLLPISAPSPLRTDLLHRQAAWPSLLSMCRHTTPAVCVSQQASLTRNQLLRGSRKPKPVRSSKVPGLAGGPFRKGVVIRTYTTAPKKPNSANRAVAKVALSTGTKVLCYIPGQRHNLQVRLAAGIAV